MQAVFTDVANALNAVAAAEDDNSAQLSSPAGAPQRFAAAVQAALASYVQPVSGYAAWFLSKLYTTFTLGPSMLKRFCQGVSGSLKVIVLSFMPCWPCSSS